MGMKNWFVFLSFYLISQIALSQEVRNVKATQEGQKIAIAYELVCQQPTEINIFLSEDNGRTWNALKTGVSGDVGTRITQGSKVIYWDVLQSKEKLVGNAFVFKVKVGEEFKTVKIGNQIWMAENLNVDHYANGDPIPEVKDYNQWSKLNSGAWCYYDNDIANRKVYGKLYNWYAVKDSRGLCPAGWHVPSDDDWTTLENYLGGREVAGGKMKAITGWKSPNTGASNQSGFQGFPGGFRNQLGSYNFIGYFGFWWSSTESYSDSAWGRELYYDSSVVYRDYYNKQLGFSVRCVRD
jgi:uncharacterized protein (TIGR02145 family)